MNRVTLYFPDSYCLANFVVEQRIRGAQVGNRDLDLTGVLSDEEIKCALLRYDAFMRKSPNLQSDDDDFPDPA